jgi:hypothetical protein
MHMTRKDASRSRSLWLSSLITVSAMAFMTTVEAFQFVPGGLVLKRSALASIHLEMLPTERQPLGDGSDKGRRIAEFMNLEPVAETETRRARLERDQETKDQFAAYGDELWNLRKKMKKLGDKLVGALNGHSNESEQLIRSELREAEARDPELVYEMEILEMELARREGDIEQAEKAKQRALNARSCLPHFNLEGLWVGK